MSNAQIAHYLHWFWTAFFAAFGAGILAASRGELGAKRAAWLLRLQDPAIKPRVRAALGKRSEMEQLSPLVKIVPAIVSFMLAAVAAFTSIEPAVLYGALLLAAAFAMAVAFVQLRNRQPVRVAVLSHRVPTAVIPPVWFAVAAVQALLALSALSVRADALGALFVCVSTLTCAVLAWRVTEMPALLAGDDIEVEQFLDERLRFHRAASVLYLALAQSFVFITQVAPFHPQAQLQYAEIASAVLWAGYSVWFFVRLLRKVDVSPAVA